MTLQNLGVVALWRGRTEEARQRLEESFAVWEATVGPESAVLVRAMGNIGAVCIEAKQYEDAAHWLARALEIGQRTFGEAHPVTVQLQELCAKALTKAGRKREGARMARAAAEARRTMGSAGTDATVDYRELAEVRRRK